LTTEGEVGFLSRFNRRKKKKKKHEGKKKRNSGGKYSKRGEDNLGGKKQLTLFIIRENLVSGGRGKPEEMVNHRVGGLWEKNVGSEGLHEKSRGGGALKSQKGKHPPFFV